MFKFFRRSMFEVALAFLLIFIVLRAPHTNAADGFLDPEVAFKFSAKMLDPKTAEVTYTIADGYYLYRERFAFKAEGAQLAAAVIPAGQVKFDENFQKKVEIYRHSVTIQLPVKAERSFILKVSAQGCADQGLCYAPMERQATLSTSSGLLALLSPLGGGSTASSDPSRLMSSNAKTQVESELERLENVLKRGRVLAVLPLFLLLGLGLAFTPCILPMMPILSSILVGEGAQISRARGFILSLAYTSGVVLVYTALGVAAGLAGQGFSAALQNPWILSAFALLMVALALSMFGVYQLQMPAMIQRQLIKTSGRQSGGKLVGVFVMGVLSALIIGPCVAAPLAAVLLYLSQTRDIVLGASALATLAFGMSVPLLLLGMSAGFLLPRTGAWMNSIKHFFGVLMLGLALWIVLPLLPAWGGRVGGVALSLGYGGYIWWATQGWLSRFIGTLALVFGLVQLGGLIMGTNVGIPFQGASKNTSKLEFKSVQSLTELNVALAQARGKAVMLDFYADWCVSCQEMEKLTFADSRVRDQFASMVLLRVDVTENNEHDKTLLKRFKLFGPPAMIFFDQQGQEVQGRQVIGYQNAETFLHSLTLGRATSN